MHASKSLKTTTEAMHVSKPSLYSLTHNKKCSILLPLIVVIVVLAEIAYFGRLDVVKNTVDVLSGSIESDELPIKREDFELTTRAEDELSVKRESLELVKEEQSGNFEAESCEEWLERQDGVPYLRNFYKQPVYIHGGEREWLTCDVGCVFGVDHDAKPDGGFGLSQPPGRAAILLSMESSKYYQENDIDIALRSGYNVVMTTSLSSDIPVGYFSWAEYDLMASVQPKTENALAAAFISNCAARNFRLQALEALERSNITIDSYGNCHRNRSGRVDKVKTLGRYKFSLAFENSNEEDYVTEKFFQSLVAGAVPVVVGAPNIQDFAPSNGSFLHIKELSDVDSVAKTMKYLAQNPDAYNQTMRWKYEGPSDSFKALVDMAAVHSSCRLCIFIATAIQNREEDRPEFKNRPCKCTRESEDVYHLYVRERGKFEMESIFLRSSNLTVKGLESAVLTKFESFDYVPVWKEDRPGSIRGGNELKVYRIYPVELTQREALYTFNFREDSDLKKHVESNPCAKFEVIFV